MTQQQDGAVPDAQREASYQACIEDRDTYVGRPDRWSFNRGYDAGRAEQNQQHSNDLIRVRREALAERTAEIVAQLGTTADALMATGDAIGAGALRGVVVFLEVDVP